MKTYSGAGVIPITIIDDKPYFVLFAYNKDIITDAGGKIEHNNSIINTASRELFEESAGLINIDDKILDENSLYLNIKNKDTYYRCYFVIINFPDNNFDKSYSDNLEKFNKFKLNPFSETKNIKLISLEDTKFINNSILLNNKKVNYLIKRTKNIFIKIHKKFIDFADFYNKIKIKLEIIKLNKKNISVNTYEYNTLKEIKIDNITTYFI
jgi:hypothetical protein